MISTDILISLGAGASIGALLVYALMAARQRELATRLDVQEKATAEKINLLEQARAQMADTFQALSSEALNKNNQQFLTLATENLQRFQQRADASLQEKQQAIAHLLQPVSETLAKMDGKIADIETKREGAYVELKTLVHAMKDQHSQLQMQTSSLVQTLRAPTTRGQWGEMQLKRVLDFSGLLDGIHYTRQATAQANNKGMRPDIMVHLPPDKVLLIDAKVPMQNYLSAMQENVSDSDKNTFLTKHALDMKNHIKTLSGKEYTQGFNSFDWVVMFVPLDGLIQMAMDKHPDLVEFAWARNVVLATPTNLLGLMRTVSYAHDQFKVTQNAREIAKIGETIYRRMSIFADHMGKMGRSLDGALDSYNKAIGSLERNVLPSLRQVKTLGIATAEGEIAVLKGLEETPRKMTAPELVGAESDGE